MAEQGHEVADIRAISLQSDRYHGWPTLVRRKNGELLVVCSGGRESHVCPFGRVELIHSFDGGETWTYARTILDGPIDDRDAGILETQKGSLLVTTFTSLAYVPGLHKAEADAERGKPTMPAEQLARWQAVHRRLPAGEHEKHLGCWMLRSEDGGLNWSPACRVPLNSPHGPINLAEGRLFYAGVALWEKDRKVGTSFSADDGRTWAVPYAIGVWGLPSHLLCLSDDRLLMTYGHRRAPLGNQARISSDNGQTWSAPMIIYGDGVSGDLGYPSTVEISPGQLITVWYEKLKDSAFAQLRMARWQLSLQRNSPGVGEWGN